MRPQAATSSRVPKLIVVGAGPKGLAIYTKADTLRRLGRPAPEVVLLERYGPAAHWAGQHGYTNGQPLLGTPPEKDVGFPYKSVFGQAVDRAMQAFSWSTYLQATGRYDAWVDRGRRHPTHEQWANYLRWVATTSGAAVKMACVVRIHRNGSTWSVDYLRADEPYTMASEHGDALVITGPGEPKRFPGQSDDSRILDGRSFWQQMRIFQDFRGGAIAVIGGGETAAAIVVALLDLVERSTVAIDVFTGHGAVFTRDESYDLNRYFSDPDGAKWTELSPESRREIIHRADRKVWSPLAKQLIDGRELVTTKVGKVQTIRAHGNSLRVFLDVDGRTTFADYTHVVNAHGFDYLSFTRLLSSDLGFSRPEEVEERLAHDLSVTGVTPKLYLPLAAGLAQGPGFPNLSCLGLLSDRILQPYCLGARHARAPRLAPLQVVEVP